MFWPVEVGAFLLLSSPNDLCNSVVNSGSTKIIILEVVSFLVTLKEPEIGSWEIGIIVGT